MALLDAPADCAISCWSDSPQMVSAQVRCYAPLPAGRDLDQFGVRRGGIHQPRACIGSSWCPTSGGSSRRSTQFEIPAYTHTCGAIGDRLDLMADTGLDGIDTLDPPPLGTVDLARAKAEFGERLFFKGNLDAVNEMLQADDETFGRPSWSGCRSASRARATSSRPPVRSRPTFNRGV